MFVAPDGEMEEGGEEALGDVGVPSPRLRPVLVEDEDVEPLRGHLLRSQKLHLNHAAHDERPLPSCMYNG